MSGRSCQTWEPRPHKPTAISALRFKHHGSNLARATVGLPHAQVSRSEVLMLPALLLIKLDTRSSVFVSHVTRRRRHNLVGFFRSLFFVFSLRCNRSLHLLYSALPTTGLFSVPLNT